MEILEIEIKGQNESDLLLAIDEVRKKINEGYTSGHDSNDTGNYYFMITEKKV